MIQLGQKLTFAGILILLLVQIRSFELDLFYDPFLLYFKSDFTNIERPAYDFWKLISSMSLRYLFNSLVSCLIIYVLFRSKSYVFYSLKFFGMMYLILFSIYAYLLQNDFPGGFNFSYSIRRLMIQPFLVLILILGFYYQELKEKG